MEKEKNHVMELLQRYQDVIRRRETEIVVEVSSGGLTLEPFYSLPVTLMSIDADGRRVTVVVSRFLAYSYPSPVIELLEHVFAKNTGSYETTTIYEITTIEDGLALALVYSDEKAEQFLENNFPLITNLLELIRKNYRGISYLGECCSDFREIIERMIKFFQEWILGQEIYDLKDSRKLVEASIRLYEQALLNSVFLYNFILNYIAEAEGLIKLMYLYHKSFIGDDEYMDFARSFIEALDDKNTFKNNRKIIDVYKPLKWLKNNVGVDMDKQVLEVNDIEIKVSDLFLLLLEAS